MYTAAVVNTTLAVFYLYSKCFRKCEAEFGCFTVIGVYVRIISTRSQLDALLAAMSSWP
jgi:hypothetical protein